MSDIRISSHMPIILSIIAALMLSIAPMPDWAEAFRPTWVVLTLIYWSMTFRMTIPCPWYFFIELPCEQSTIMVSGIFFSIRFKRACSILMGS